MIRPVLYVDLPGIIYAIDHRARGNQRDFANFICWLEAVENAHPSPPILRHLFPIPPVIRTWICEDHWRLLGFAQVRDDHPILPGISLTSHRWQQRCNQFSG